MKYVVALLCLGLPTIAFAQLPPGLPGLQQSTTLRPDIQKPGQFQIFKDGVVIGYIRPDIQMPGEFKIIDQDFSFIGQIRPDPQSDWEINDE